MKHLNQKKLLTPACMLIMLLGSQTASYPVLPKPQFPTPAAPAPLAPQQVPKLMELCSNILPTVLCAQNDSIAEVVSQMMEYLIQLPNPIKAFILDSTLRTQTVTEITKNNGAVVLLAIYDYCQNLQGDPALLAETQDIMIGIRHLVQANRSRFTYACKKLIQANNNACTTLLQTLLATGFGPNTIITDNGIAPYSQTPLIYAVKKGNFEAVQTLVTSGAFLNRQDSNKMTAITHAGIRSQHNIFQYLMTHGADTSIRDAHGRDAIMRKRKR